MSSISRCSICGNDDFSVKYHLFDDRYGYPGEFDVGKCKKCTHIFSVNELSEQQQSDLYTKYYPRSENHHEKISVFKDIDNNFDAWLSGEKSRAFRWVPKNVRVLDIGCGYGETVAYHQRRGCEAYGVDMDENVGRVNKSSRIKVGPFDPGDYEKEFFDYVTLDQVLEHIHDPIRFLQDVKSVLKPDGFIIIATPNSGGWGRRLFGKKWVHWHIPYHCQFFTKRSLKLAASKSDLIIIRQSTITDSIWLHLQWMHLLFYPEITRPSEFWGSHLISGQDKQKTQSARSRKEKLIGFFWRRKVNDVITRICDLAGFGDNHLCIMRK